MKHTYVRERLAQFVHKMNKDALPVAVIHESKRLILDTLGCAVGAYQSIPGKTVLGVVEQLGSAEHSSLIGTNWKTSAPLATFYNGTLIRYLDSNDYYFGNDSGHPSSNIPAALALSQQLGRNGKELITSIVIGYEVHMRLCDAVAPPGISGHGWHTATHVQFSTAALAAWLLNNDPLIIANALSIAGSHNNTLAEAQRGDIPLMKATAEAYIAKGAIEAAFLAAEGLTGPAGVFEGAAGWEKSVAVSVDYDLLTAPLNSTYRMMSSCMKPYPVVAGAIAPIQAAIDLKIDQTKIKEIETVIIKLPRVTAKKALSDPQKLHPKDKETADHSIHYCVAVALLYGKVGHEHFDLQIINSSAVADLIQKIQIEENQELTALYPQSSGSAIVVRLQDGTELQQTCRYPPGHPQNRVSDSEVERKFFEMTEGVLSRSRAQRVIEIIWGLDQCNQFDDLFSHLIGDIQ